MSHRTNDERMSVFDVPFWDYGDGNTRQAIAMLLEFDGRVDHAELVARTECLVARAPRMRQRVVETPGRVTRPFWADVPDLDVAARIRFERLGSRPLPAVASDAYTAPMSRAGVLWDLTLFETLDGRSVMFYRTHHAMGDGGSILTVARELCDPTDGIGLRVPRHAAGSEYKGFLRAALDFSKNLHRRRAPIWEGGLSARRDLSTAVFELDRLRALRRRHDVTFNDVFQTVVALAVENILDVQVPEITISMPLAVSAASYERGGDLDLGSRQVSLNLHVPMGTTTPVERLHAIAEQAAKLKDGRASVRLLTAMAAESPRRLVKAVTRRKITGCNMISSNFPGDLHEHTLGGVAMRSAFYFTALAPGCPVAIVASTYRDEVQIGVNADPTLVPHVDELPRQLEAGLERLESATG